MKGMLWQFVCRGKAHSNILTPLLSRCTFDIRRHKICRYTPYSTTAVCHDGHETFFRHTSRRWIYNEDLRTAERYVRFNVQELKLAAAKAAGRSRCVRIEKLAEGGFNRIFLLTMNDGFEVIARIPYPIAGPRHYSTASEVATMDFLRRFHGLPVPQVFAYSSTVDSQNPVGAEYIIMERVHGSSLASRWHSLSKGELVDVMKQVVGFEEKVFAIRFPRFGSLYYKKDIEGSSSSTGGYRSEYLPKEFCIGPLAKRQFWFDERAGMDIDRGPWEHAADYLTAIAHREISWTKRFRKPRRREFFFSYTDHEIEPQDHVSLLSDYCRVVPDLVPEEELKIPTLRHPDLSLSNIILDSKSTKIVGIIDWQDASVLPFFLQAGLPPFCNHDPTVPVALETPRLPEAFNEMTEYEQQKAVGKLRFEEACLYYVAASGLESSHIKALRTPYLNMRQYLVAQAGLPWDGDLVNLRAALVGLQEKWKYIAGNDTSCPITYSDETRSAAMEESRNWNEAASMVATMRDSLGIDGEGGTDVDNFEYAKEMNEQGRLEMLKEADPEEREKSWEVWPFKDDGDCSKPLTLP